MPSKPILRFAPSPNGYLHLGHAFSALVTWHVAQVLDGAALLRIEDIDLQRSKPEFTAAIFEDLQWLGLSWPEPVMHQRDRFAAYAQAFEMLMQMGLLYPCYCSRTEVAAHADGTDPDGAPRYGGTCRGLSPEVIAGRLAAGERAVFRLRTDTASARVGRCEIHEVLLEGHELRLDKPRTREAHPEDWGDVVLVRKDTPTSYHLSVVVDDAAQEVTHVTRGMDLYRATDLHVLLQALLGLPSPVYAHHRLIVDDGDRKLAKSRGSTALRELRAAGWSATEARGAVGFD